jgi:hypothetical protein
MLLMDKYYKQINDALISYENYKPYHTKTIDWICNRIDWAWKWRKINKEEMVELAERVTKLFEEGVV